MCAVYGVVERGALPINGFENIDGRLAVVRKDERKDMPFDVCQRFWQCSSFKMTFLRWRCMCLPVPTSLVHRHWEPQLLPVHSLACPRQAALAATGWARHPSTIAAAAAAVAAASSLAEGRGQPPPLRHKPRSSRHQHKDKEGPLAARRRDYYQRSVQRRRRPVTQRR